MVMQCIKLRPDPPSGISRLEIGTVAKVISGGPELKKWEYLVVRQPRVAEVFSRSIFGPANANARICTVEIDNALLRVEELIHGRQVAVGAWVVLTCIDFEVAVGAAKHVLFLGNRTLDICPARHTGIGHIEDREAGSNLSC